MEKRRKQSLDLSELGWPLESQLLFPSKKVIRARKQTKAWGKLFKKRDKGKAGNRGRLEAASAPAGSPKGTVWVLLGTLQDLNLDFYYPEP